MSQFLGSNIAKTVINVFDIKEVPEAVNLQMDKIDRRFKC